jgi:hypothetical protein
MISNQQKAIDYFLPCHRKKKELCISMGMYANEKARRSEEENIEEG